MTRRSGAARALALHRHLMRFGEAETKVAEAWSARGTTVAAVGHRLAGLWSGSGQAPGQVMAERGLPIGLPHARASVLNLIITVPDVRAAARVVRTMQGLGAQHPSRAIVLVADRDAPGPPLDASISAHCHDGNGGGDQVCYDVVVLTVRGEAAEHLAGFVAPLLIHDLPTHVWWPGDPPFEHPVFDQLVEMSDRVIVDSSDIADLLIGYRRLATLRRRSGVGDLAWRRLAWWQELTAQFFDGPRYRRYLPNLNRLAIRYAVAPADGRRPRVASADVAPGVASPLASPMLYAGWLASRLTWRRYRTIGPLGPDGMRLQLEGAHEMVDLRLEPVASSEHLPGELLSVRLQARGEMGSAEFIIDRSGDEATVATNADGMTAQLRRMTMERPTESELLALDLVTDRHDPIYEASLRAAAVFLSSARPSEASA
jgi:glucose-6-phosphate dehydrogenase assembly protein OpcA